jgi:NDP-sugar pyrophosphorylase family protein
MAGSLADVTAAVLAGGLGTRLRAAVADRPKVLAPVHGRPYLAYLLDQLAAAGVRAAVLLTGYQAGRVRSAFGDAHAGMRLAYSPEPVPLGTAGALRHALPLLSSPTVLVMNGDSYCDVALPDFADFHRRQAAEVSLVLARVEDGARFGSVRLTPEGRVLRFEEKQAGAGASWINAGVYLLDRALVDEIPAGRPVSLEREMFPAWAGRGRCHGYRSAGRFLDIGTPASYAEAEAFFPAGSCAGKRRV